MFVPGENNPIRIEYFGNTIESIRYYDSVSQLSINPVDFATINPASLIIHPQKFIKLFGMDSEDSNSQVRLKEYHAMIHGSRPDNTLFWQPFFNRSTLLDYLSTSTNIIIDSPESIEQKWHFITKEIEIRRQERLSQNAIPESYPSPVHDWAHLLGLLNGFSTVALHLWDSPKIKLDFKSFPAPNYTGKLEYFYQHLNELIQNGRLIVIATHQIERIKDLLQQHNISFIEDFSILKQHHPGAVFLTAAPVEPGVVIADYLHIFTDRELFGFSKISRPRITNNKRSLAHDDLAKFVAGDLVVHVDHGIGVFEGIVKTKVSGAVKDYLLVKYAQEDRLYVPVEQTTRLSKYIGSTGKTPKLNKLDSVEWNRTKANAEKAADELAEEFLELYCARQTADGFPYSNDTVWQRELEGSFPYVETLDQLRTVDEIKKDMEKPLPMDRLVLGDVGYGKTEVAIRAAFKAVMDNRQVAVLVPTTVLAQQHFNTFTQRMAAFPTVIESLSRFRTETEQSSILERLTTGGIDIIIGTHRLLQSDVKFKDLGLVIIDEEQRFGVLHKEFFKKMRKEIDILTLSATPIPRTLEMALSGIKDISIIDTAPQERLPVKTIVSVFDPYLIRDAITTEMERDGQTFFVHNRVADIFEIAGTLGDIVPEAVIQVAHGQMSERELESVITEFINNKIDVLVCTTIIESGVDIPNANTIIINHADKLGLTQLYQLRGRVGRSTQSAYAYLLYPKNCEFTGNSARRLQTIFEATSLGSGYDIALKDLEIRGAGTFLGTKQSGQISAVGFHLYTNMLKDAINNKRTQTSPSLPTRQINSEYFPPVIEIPLNAFIPETYVPEETDRIAYYQRMSNIENLSEVDAIYSELRDRFGAVPPEMADLFFLLRLRVIGYKAGINRISKQPGNITITFRPGFTPNGEIGLPKDISTVIIGRSLVIDSLDADAWRDQLEKIAWFLCKQRSEI